MNYLIGNNIKSNKPSAGIATNDHKIRFVLSYIAGKRVLDLGCVQHNPYNCNNKYWLHKAIEKYADYVVGIDLYEPGVIALRSKGYNVIIGDAENFRLNEKFDVIVAGDIIEHLSNPGKMIECAKLHTKRGGLLLISTPNPWYWRFAIKAILFGSSNPNPEHTAWFCRDTIEKLLRRYNWRIKEVRYASRYFLDNILPLPHTLKHNSIHICAEMP